MLRKFIATLCLTMATSANAELSWIAPPAVDRPQEISTRGVELCLGLNLLKSLELYAEFKLVHEKTPFSSVEQIMLEDNFQPYLKSMQAINAFSLYIEKAAPELALSGRINEDTLIDLKQFYKDTSFSQKQEKLVLCQGYVPVIIPFLDKEEPLSTETVKYREKVLAQGLLTLLDKKVEELMN